MDDLHRLRLELISEDAANRANAAECLGMAGANAACAAIELVRACGDTEEVRDWAVAALENMGPPAIDMQTQLEELAISKDSLVSYWAITLLGRLGATATSSQKVLSQVLSNSEDLSVRERAAWSLGQIGVTIDDAVKALEQAEGAGEPRLSRLAKEALLQIQG